MATYRDVLVIAPDVGLPDVEAEARGLSEALHPVSLRNGVTVRDVTERIAHQPWDVIWFACHGSAQGVQLTDGLLDTATLVSLVRAAGAQLVVLNTCESDMVGIYIWALTGAAVICTLASVPDKAAYVTGRLLADGLGRGLSIEDAFKRSRPGDMGQAARYRMWDGNETERAQDTDALRAATVQAMAAVMQPMAQQVESMRAEVQPVAQQVEALRGELQAVRGLVSVKRVTLQQRLLWLVGIVLLLAPFLTADTLYARHFFLPWWLGLSAALAFVGVGIWLLMQGNGMLRS